MQNNDHAWNRRRFLQGSLAAAACSFARPSSADESAAAPLLDTQVYVGQWPLRRLTDDATSLTDTLRRHQVSCAWAGSFDALFHKDIYGANLRLVETCRDDGDGILVPFGAVNPTLPDWEEDLRRCHEHFKMSGIRLHPNYHGYTLDDPRFARLLEMAADRKLIVQLVAWMTDERHLLLNPSVAQVDLAPLGERVRALDGIYLLVSNASRTVDDLSLRTLAPRQQVCFDFSRLASAEELGELVELVSADRIVFGSLSPLADFGSSTQIMGHARLTAAQTRAISYGSAQRLARAVSTNAYPRSPR